MQNFLGNQLLASLIALGVSVPTPLLPYKDHPNAVLAGLAGGIVVGAAGTTLVANRRKQSAAVNDQSLTCIQVEPEANPATPEDADNAVESDVSKPAAKRRRSPRTKKRVNPMLQNEAVTAWLESQQIQVLKHRLPQETDVVYDPIAMHLGKHYAVLGPLHRKIRRSQEQGIPFHYDLQGADQRDIAICTRYCQMLNEASFLSSYQYRKKEKVVKGTVQQRGDLCQFLNGGWFERYIFAQVSQKLAKDGKVDCLVNPQLVFPGGNRFELDLLFLVEQKPLWIECKSGNHYNDCLPKYCQHRENLSLSKEQAFLVGLELPDVQAQKMTAVWSITVTNEKQILEAIEQRLTA